MKKIGLLFIILSALLVTGCNNKQTSEQIKAVLREDPTILLEAIKKDQIAFIEAFQEAFKYYKENLKPSLGDDEAYRGDRNAPLVLVEYSDFECPYCKKGYERVVEMMQKYGNKMVFIYKHVPLSFHKQAMISAQYFEAIKLQSVEKAYEFHDKVFSEQSKLVSAGEPFLKSVAESLKINMDRVQKDLNSQIVLKKIQKDQEEAARLGIQGTPNFILNGVPVRGAQPLEAFVAVVEDLKAKKRLPASL